MLRLVLASLAALCLFVLPAGAQDQQAGLPALIDARVTTTGERARLVVDLTAPTEFAIASLAEPNRIAVDVRASAVTAKDLQPPAGDGIVAGYAIELAEEGRARALLELASPAQVQQAYILEAFEDQPARLVVDLIPDTEERFAKRVAEDFAAAQARAEQQELVPATPTEPGDTNVEITTASKPLIVLDPGHGGVDGGAETAGGIKEKDITLAFALNLQKLLVETGRFDVALTREDDSFVRLEDRVALARSNKADLFISIHADSFQEPTARGASVYTRDERATDILDKVLAEQENRVDLIAGFAVPRMEDRVVNILVDLMRREMRRQSYVAARNIVEQLEPSIRLRRFPVRQADFFVLQAPDVPSVLLELGFLSNPEDIKNLAEQGWRDRVGEALARGIAAYFDLMAQS